MFVLKATFYSSPYLPPPSKLMTGKTLASYHHEKNIIVQHDIHFIVDKSQFSRNVVSEEFGDTRAKAAVE